GKCDQCSASCAVLGSLPLRVELRHGATPAINCNFLNTLLHFARRLGNAFRLFYYFAVYFDCFEAVADSGLTDIPQRLLDPPALLMNEIFLLQLAYLRRV